jgi:hypothetical protein
MLLSPPLAALGATEAVGYMASPDVEHGVLADAGFAASFTTTMAKSRARARCTWNGCDYRNPNPEDMK